MIKDDKAEIVRYEDEESVISSIAESYIGLNICFKKKWFVNIKKTCKTKFNVYDIIGTFEENAQSKLEISNNMVKKMDSCLFN